MNPQDLLIFPVTVGILRQVQGTALGPSNRDLHRRARAQKVGAVGRGLRQGGRQETRDSPERHGEGSGGPDEPGNV